MNLHVWKKLPKHLRILLVKHTEKMAHFNIEDQVAQLKKEEGAFKKDGMQFIDLSPVEAAKYKKTADDALYNTIEKKAPKEAKKLLKMITKK
jgi:TRAP-type C4-dicarboxylate transport system substrate-binding protein